MISKHCGVLLEYEKGRFTDSRLKFHQWRCPICRKRFTQRVRQPKEKTNGNQN